MTDCALDQDVKDDVSAFFQQAKESSLACPKTISVKEFQIQLQLYRAKVSRQWCKDRC